MYIKKTYKKDIVNWTYIMYVHKVSRRTSKLCDAVDSNEKECTLKVEVERESSREQEELEDKKED